MKVLPLKKPVLPSKRMAKLIEAVENGKEGQHVMSQYISPHMTVEKIVKGEVKSFYCGTAGCVAGWATLARNEPKKALAMELNEHMDSLRYFVGPSVPNEVLEHLIAGVDHDGVSNYTGRSSLGINLIGFDRLPPRKRKSAMLKVLRTFAETGRIEWHKVAGKASREALSPRDLD